MKNRYKLIDGNRSGKPIRTDESLSRRLLSSSRIDIRSGQPRNPEVISLDM
ncbi:hypothetical protein [Roseovarius amoyensis]|uniref:hypothetical protein n=1 Tax=Roseovarius amoyensis TaxID=2211448 RepID=UPI0019550135|nr:hypothetical protein [Roseovarius amoyensis]